MSDLMQGLSERLDWFKNRRKEFNAYQNEMLNSDRYKKEYKRTELNNAHLALSREFAEKKRELYDFIEKERAYHKRVSFGIGYKPDEDKIRSYRDALQRVQSLKDKSKKAEVLKSAMEVGDKIQEYAVLKDAYEGGNTGLLNQYNGGRREQIEQLFEFEKTVDSPDFKMSLQVQTSVPPMAKIY